MLRCESTTKVDAADGGVLHMSLDHPIDRFNMDIFALLANGVNASLTLTKPNGDTFTYTLAYGK